MNDSYKGLDKLAQVGIQIGPKRQASIIEYSEEDIKAVKEPGVMSTIAENGDDDDDEEEEEEEEVKNKEGEE